MPHEKLIELYQACFPLKDAKKELQALGNDFKFEIESDESFIIYKIVSGTEAEIIDMGTSPGFRNKGHAAKLLRKTIAKLKKLKFKIIYLEVAANNIPAIKLYQNCGFKKYNVRKDYYQINGEKIDAILMRNLFDL